jgi:hypothetical protein
MVRWISAALVLSALGLAACNPAQEGCEAVANTCAGVPDSYLPNCLGNAERAAQYNRACEEVVDLYGGCLVDAVDRSEEAASDSDSKNGPGSFAGKVGCDLTACDELGAQVKACSDAVAAENRQVDDTGTGGASSTTSGTTSTTSTGGAP